VIARGSGYDPGGLISERHQRIGGSPKLEGTGGLQVLQLEVDVRPASLAQDMRVLDWRVPDVGRDASGGGVTVGVEIRERGHRSVSRFLAEPAHLIEVTWNRAVAHDRPRSDMGE
jgi:hypothetical protein